VAKLGVTRRGGGPQGPHRHASDNIPRQGVAPRPPFTLAHTPTSTSMHSTRSIRTKVPSKQSRNPYREERPIARAHARRDPDLTSPWPAEPRLYARRVDGAPWGPRLEELSCFSRPAGLLLFEKAFSGRSPSCRARRISRSGQPSSAASTAASTEGILASSPRLHQGAPSLSAPIHPEPRQLEALLLRLMAWPAIFPPAIRPRTPKTHFLNPFPRRELVGVGLSAAVGPRRSWPYNPISHQFGNLLIC